MRVAKTPPRVIYLSPTRTYEATYSALYRIGVSDATTRILAILAQHRRAPFDDLPATIIAAADHLAGYEECPNN